MTPKLTCHFAGLDIEYHDSSINLIETINIDALRTLALKRTRPEARKSPLRLNLRQVAWPDPDCMISDVDVAIVTVNQLSFPVKASG